MPCTCGGATTRGRDVVIVSSFWLYAIRGAPMRVVTEGGERFRNERADREASAVSEAALL